MSWKPNQDLKSFDKAPPFKSQNSSPQNKQNLNDKFSSKSRSKNRAYNTNRDNDSVKDFTVTLDKVDSTIVDHLESLKLEVVSEGISKSTTITFANPERWVAVQKLGFERDHKGQIQLPMMMISRNTSQRNDALKVFNRYGDLLSMPFIRKYSPKNAYDRFSLSTNNHKPVHEVYSVNIPDHFIITYNCMVWTDLIQQNNDLVERISYNSEDYWGSDQLKFRTTISNFNLQTQVGDGENRVIRSDFDIQVYCYLLPEFYKNWKQTTIKSLTPRRVIFGTEIESTNGRFDTDKNKLL